MPEPVIVAATRSPIGRARKGSLVDVRPDDLAAEMVSAVLAKVPQLDHGEIEDLMLGCGMPGGEQGFNMARVVAVLAGLDHVPATTVNRYCSSSLQTIRMAAHAIHAGEGDVFIAGGVEMVSRFDKGHADSLPDTQNPRFATAGQRTAARAEGGAQPWAPAEGLPDMYIAMGQTAENVAEHCDVSREQMDAFAALSQQRAEASVAEGFFDREITPVTLPSGQVMHASKRALDRAGMTIDDVDRVELNEAFAAQVIPSADQMGVDTDRLNVHGGSIALGHPFGMTGARIMTTLLNVLETDDVTVGLETMCVGGGQGMAMVVERL